MKKFFILLAVAFGMVAMQSCNSCTKESGVASTEFIYDLQGVAEGQGRFMWEALPHTGDITLDGKLTASATNDTASAKVLTLNAVAGAPTLAAGLVSNDAKVQEAAKEVEKRLNFTHISGSYKLKANGYVKYGPMYFVIDEEFPKAQ